MELFKTITHSGNWANYILKITGNSQFRILNDYEAGLIDVKYLTYLNGALYLEVVNPNTNMHDIDGFDDHMHKKLSYIKFTYVATKCPRIEFVWNFYEFTPFHVIYPVCRPTKETCDTFGIVYDTVELNQNEMTKNNRILDKEYIDYVQDKRSAENSKYHSPFAKKLRKKKIKYPRYVSKYDTMIKLKRGRHKSTVPPTETPS